MMAAEEATALKKKKQILDFRSCQSETINKQPTQPKIADGKMNSTVMETPFPAAGLVPKADTGILSFLQKYPEYDGRDVTIAIFDSGVDSRACGLQTLCDGKTVKVIERHDCSGSGDTDTTKKVTADANGYLTGLSGRQLKLTAEMIASNTANGEFRLGLKNVHDLSPSKVRENRANANKIKHWDSSHKQAIAEIVREINNFDAQHAANGKDNSKLPWDKKLIKEDLENRLELLNTYEKIYCDIETSYDCVLYQTENGWQAVIDTTENGDLENAVHIGEYYKTHEIKNVDDYLSVSVNVHDNGDVLEIVGMCSSHGTHVASIAAGNKTCPDVDGVAPNAKIVSLTIGDGRLGSMETGKALVRAMIKVMEMCREGRKIDVINMSYGEHAHWSSSGRIGELMNEIVNKYGVAWVVSAGNNGPALCTIGTPPDISQPSCIGVGAYVSPQMMEADYSLREKLPANVYSWTSRDPCIDGGQGVTVCAPGGAITSVPQFTMSKAQLMSGTSMAAPHVAGALALIISGLKQKGVQYSPYSIKRALAATATQLSYVDPFAQGSGLLNVEKAFEHLLEYDKAAENMIRFSVRVGPQNAKGIHLRQGELKKPYEFTVEIQPLFYNDTEVDPAKKYNFNIRLNLVPSKPFVQCGAFLDLNYSTRTIVVKVDPTGLPPGVHTAVVRAYDSNCVQKGAMFDIPVTVVQPMVLNCAESRTFEPIVSGSNDGSMIFQPNTIQRDFILVPNKATWAVLRMISLDKNKVVGKFFVHTMQILPKKSCRSLETLKFLSVTSENESSVTFKVEENNILELCIAKHWSNFGTTHLKYSLEFHGLQAANPQGSMMHAGRGIHALEVTSLNSEEIQPQVQLKTAALVLRPTESKVAALSAPRDVLPQGRQIYHNLLTYSLQLSKSADVALYAPMFNRLLYESEFESNLWMLFDANKNLICTGDSYTEKSFKKLEKGEYTIRLQVRHEKRDLLEKISEANMLAVFRLNNAIPMDVFDHYNQCIVSGRKFNSCMVHENVPKVLYIAPLTQEKLSKANIPANSAILCGSLSLAKDEGGRRVDTQDFLYVLNPPDSAKKTNGANGNSNSGNCAATVSKISTVATQLATSTGGSEQGDGVPTPPSNATNTSDNTVVPSPKKGKISADDYAEALRDFQCSMIGKCDLEKAEKIFEEVSTAYPKYFAAHINLIQNLETSLPKLQYPLTFCKSVQAPTAIAGEDSQDAQKNTLKRIAQLAQTICNETDQNALLAFYGMKSDTRPDAAKLKTNMDKSRNHLLEALMKRGVAVAKLYLLDNTLKDHKDELNNIYLEILKFVEATDSKVVQFSIWHAYAHEQYGRMYKYMQKIFEDKRSRELYDELSLLVEAMKYQHLLTVVQRRTVSLFPSTYRAF